MLKPLLVAAVVLAQVSAAPPPMSGPRVPMPNMEFGQRMDGITVTGNGYASAQATQADVMLHVSTRANALTLTRQTLQPIVDAHTNSATITAGVHHPTQAMLQQGMLALANTFASMPDILLNGAEIRLAAGNCVTLQHNAEASAISSARANAAFLAHQIGDKVGSVLAINAGGMPMGSESACSFTYYIGPYGAPQQMSPADMLTVKVYSNVTMRFAIKR
jgi:uncharacterized protein YggE